MNVQVRQYSTQGSRAATAAKPRRPRCWDASVQAKVKRSLPDHRCAILAGHHRPAVRQPADPDPRPGPAFSACHAGPPVPLCGREGLRIEHQLIGLGHALTIADPQEYEKCRTERVADDRLPAQVAAEVPPPPHDRGPAGGTSRSRRCPWSPGWPLPPMDLD